MRLSPPAPDLPVLNGVGPSRVVLPSGNWLTILDFLSERFPHVDKLQWQARMLERKVLKHDGSAVYPEEPYRPQQSIFYYRHVDTELALPFSVKVLFEDEHLVVADKPHFMPVTPGGHYLQNSVLVQLKHVTGCRTLSPVHRLDRETAGLVLLCKQAGDRAAYHAMFRQHRVHKSYEAVAGYREELIAPKVHRSRIEDDPRFFLSREVAGAPNSETRVRMLKRLDESALYLLEPVTGRRHQLRLHMWSLGAPVFGDQFYPTVIRGPNEPDDFSSPLQLLAKRLAFIDPVTGQQREWSSQQTLKLSEEHAPV